MAAATEKSLPTLVSELWALVVAYVKQETVQPLKALGRFVGIGVAATALLSVGLVLLTLSGLRALQTETGTTFSGNLSWAPYLITLVGTAVVIALALRAIGAARRAHKGD